jgi:regulator of cell morphogenesis and NO signaling
LDTPIGYLVAERPGLARVFDRLGIDYCCGGRATLIQACAEKGIDIREIVRELDSDDAQSLERDGSDGSTIATLGELVDHVVETHHAYLRRELPRLAVLSDKVSAAHATAHPELLELHDVFADLKGDLELHMLKEEKVLFPLIKKLEAATMSGLTDASVSNPIHMMEHEHASAGHALQRMRALTGGYAAPPDACASYHALLQGMADLEADLHQHVHKENNVLFARASALEADMLLAARR